MGKIVKSVCLILCVLIRVFLYLSGCFCIYKSVPVFIRVFAFFYPLPPSNIKKKLKKSKTLGVDVNKFEPYALAVCNTTPNVKMYHQYVPQQICYPCEGRPVFVHVPPPLNRALWGTFLGPYFTILKGWIVLLLINYSIAAR